MNPYALLTLSPDSIAYFTLSANVLRASASCVAI
jgi:hypothetical protein